MKTKIFLLFTVLVLAVSCAKNNPVNGNTGGTEITIVSYVGTYTGTAQYKVIPNGSPQEENITVIIDNNGSVTIETQAQSKVFNSLVKISDKEYSYNNSPYIFYIFFDESGNAGIDYTIQNTEDGTSEKYTANKLTKN